MYELWDSIKVLRTTLWSPVHCVSLSTWKSDLGGLSRFKSNAWKQWPGAISVTQDWGINAATGILPVLHLCGLVGLGEPATICHSQILKAVRENRTQLNDLFATVQRKLRSLSSRPIHTHYQITSNDCMPSQHAYHDNYLVVQRSTDWKPLLHLNSKTDICL